MIAAASVGAVRVGASTMRLPSWTFVLDPATIILDLHGSLEGTYVLEEQRADGSLVIRPEPTLADMQARHGLPPVDPGDLPDWFHGLPADDEG